jgi:hypothetical protein
MVFGSDFSYDLHRFFNKNLEKHNISLSIKISKNEEGKSSCAFFLMNANQLFCGNYWCVLGGWAFFVYRQIVASYALSCRWLHHTPLITFTGLHVSIVNAHLNLKKTHTYQSKNTRKKRRITPPSKVVFLYLLPSLNEKCVFSCL